MAPLFIQDAVSATRRAASTLRPRIKGLSGRLLILTVLFLLAVEVLIVIPTLAAFRSQMLQDRVEAAQLASLAVEAAPPGAPLSDMLRRELLANAEVIFVLLQRDGRRQLLLAPTAPVMTEMVVDLRTRTLWSAILETCATLFARGPDYIRVVDTPRLEGGEAIEIIVPHQPMRAALWTFTWRIVITSIALSAAVGVMVYIALTVSFVGPMRALAEAMTRFRAAPHDARTRITPSGREDEIGVAERELEALQTEIRKALTQRERLAALGEGVAKINHDLRNVLTAAQLISDRLAASADPNTRRSGERLVRAIGRGVRLAEDVLEFGRAEEPAPALDRVALAPALEDAFADAVTAVDRPTGLDAHIPNDLNVYADADHVHRIFVNLIRNAVQAMAAQSGRDRPGMIALTAETTGGSIIVTVADDGPGLPDRVKARLFEPFTSAQRKGGSGLGLSIARELARANGGDVTLARSDDAGAKFAVTLPLWSHKDVS